MEQENPLLNIIQQNIEPDSGEIVYKDNLNIGFLAQELPETGLTNTEIVTNGLGEIGHLLVEYEKRFHLAIMKRLLMTKITLCPKRN